MAVEEIAKVISNWRAADLDNQEKTMLAFTEKFTLTPSQITDEKSKRCATPALAMRKFFLGLGPGYRNSVDRIADLLGVEEEKFDFPQESLKAFGVRREQLQTSLYEDDR
jgi:hypothetical protein